MGMNEVYYKVFDNDPNMLGSRFWCDGSKAIGKVGGNSRSIGIQISYTTFDAKREIVEIASIKGCPFLKKDENHKCGLDEGVCIVPGAVSPEQYWERIRQLRMLKPFE